MQSFSKFDPVVSLAGASLNHRLTAAMPSASVNLVASEMFKAGSLSLTVDGGMECLAHRFDGGGLAGPDFEGFCTLVEEHAQAVGGLCTGGLGGLQKGCLGWLINHVVGMRR